jgi:hypothetical protein
MGPMGRCLFVLPRLQMQLRKPGVSLCPARVFAGFVKGDNIFGMMLYLEVVGQYLVLVCMVG